VFVLSLLLHGLQYVGYALEISLVATLLVQKWWRKYPAFFVYVAAFAFIDAILRPSVLYSYGRASQAYLYAYWTTDIVLTLGAFLLICFLFHRACAQKKDLWPVLRTMLISVFVLVGFISCFTMSQHYQHLAPAFVIEFSQNIYFSCLVLNTLLYIMLQYVDCADESLNLLVCGLGIQFAGSAAGMALAYVMSGGIALPSFVAQFCNLGMCLTWLYAVTRNPEKAPVRSSPTRYRPVPAFVEAHVHGMH
jgi:hypothetical protein